MEISWNAKDKDSKDDKNGGTKKKEILFYVLRTVHKKRGKIFQNGWL